jgi:molybdenum cofactor biosynthesis enzyme MoaA
MSNAELVGGKTKDEIRSIDLFITEQCNMKCDYCFHPRARWCYRLSRERKSLSG